MSVYTTYRKIKKNRERKLITERKRKNLNLLRGGGGGGGTIF